MVSVVIPMYNAKNTIIRCLNSIANQTYNGDLEIIVVNDGSRDDSEKLVSDFISINNGIKIKLVNQPNGGVSKARNTGLKNVRGNIVAFLDSDDEWLPSKLDMQIPYLTDNNLNIDFLGAGFDGFLNKKRPIGALIKISLKSLLFKHMFQPSTVIMKKNIVDDVGFFDETQNYAEEGNYFIRIAKIYNCYFLNEKVIVYGDGKHGFGVSGLSANLKEMEKGELRNIKFAYKSGFVNIFTFIAATGYSLLRYARRILLTKLRT